MKSLKFLSVLAMAGSLLFSFSSCKKGNDSVSKNTVTKDQLAGQWNMTVVYQGSIQFHSTLKGNGAMELDAAPYDGIPDEILLWDMSGNNFTAHLDANGITNYWKLEGTIDPGTLSIVGTLKVDNSPNPNITAPFTMDKQ